MKQDIVPPVNYQRGKLQPLERPVVPFVRPVAPRRPGAVFSDIVSVPKPQPAMVEQPAVVAEPAPAPVTLVQDVQLVRPQRLEIVPINATVEIEPLAPVVPVAAAPAPVSATSMELAGDSESTKSDTIVEKKVKVPKQPKAPKDPNAKKKFNLKTHGLIILAIILLGITTYVAIDTWFTNRSAQALGTPTATASDDTTTITKDEEGKDESAISPASLTNYKVSPELPKALYINKLKIAARTLPMSVHKDGSIQSPKNIFDAGWYTGSVKPGEIGAMFIDGHASGATREGLFAYLDTLVVGDKLQIEKGDNTQLTYKVVHVETVPLEGLDMQKVLLPYGNTLRGLNIMTCTGTWVDDLKTYDHRVLVYTEQIVE